MARRQSVSEIRVDVVPSIQDPNAPTVTELNAGVPLTGLMTRDGLTTPDSGRTVDASDLAELQDKTQRGSRGGDSLTITAHRDSDSQADAAWEALDVDVDAFVVIRRFGGSSTPWSGGDGESDGDVVEVWPISVISREMAGTSGDQTQRFTATCAVTGQVVYDAEVVPGGE